MGAKRKSYTPKFRADAARLVIETGRSIAEVAREIGVGESLLGRWVAVERAKMEDPPEVLTGIQDGHDGGVDGGDVWV